MVRNAVFSDTPEIEKLIHNAHKRSKYSGRTGINAKALTQLVLGLVAGQNQNGPGATFAVVAEDGGKIVGFMGGMLNRIYNIGDKLGATDLFLLNEGGHLINTLSMVDEYIRWARANPKVIEIGLSWSDSITGAEGAKALYKRLGATKTGESYEIKLDVEQPGDWERVAA